MRFAGYLVSILCFPTFSRFYSNCWIWKWSFPSCTICSLTLLWQQTFYFLSCRRPYVLGWSAFHKNNVYSKTCPWWLWKGNKHSSRDTVYIIFFLLFRAFLPFWLERCFMAISVKHMPYVEDLGWKNINYVINKFVYWLHT